MPGWARSVFRGFVLLLLAYVAVAWAVEQGLGPWGWGLVVLGLGAWLGYRAFRLARSRRARREALWERAIYEDSIRPRAVREVRKALSKLPPEPTDNKLDEMVRLRLSLAELLDAGDDYAAAVEAVEGIPLERLSLIDEGLVRHTRAVTQLRAGRTEDALATLADRTPSGDRELDQRLQLLEAYARAEHGEAERVLSEADEMESDPTVDPSVATEARVVMAAALDVLGRREEALVVLTPVGRSALQSVSRLGLPRVRSMAKSILRSTTSKPPETVEDV